MAQMVKNLPMMQETWVQSLGWEDPLEKERRTHSMPLLSCGPPSLNVPENPPPEASLYPHCGLNVCPPVKFIC